MSSESDASHENTQCKGRNNVGKELSNISEKLALLLPLTVKVDALLGMKVTVDAIEKSVQLLSDKYDEFVKRLDSQDKAILAERVEKVEEANSAHEIKRLNQQLNELEEGG